MNNEFNKNQVITLIILQVKLNPLQGEQYFT